jgi:micrococcal nuclease
MKWIIVCAIMACACLASGGDEIIKGSVTKVIDGNTIELITEDRTSYKILLRGIDSPEPGQHYADQARKFLEKIVLNKSVIIHIHGKDRYGNRLGDLRINDAIDLEKELVKEGLAWTSEKNPEKELEELKEQARLSGKGLWGEKTPIPPWIFRRQQSMMEAKSI